MRYLFYEIYYYYKIETIQRYIYQEVIGIFELIKYCFVYWFLEEYVIQLRGVKIKEKEIRWVLFCYNKVNFIYIIL